ncbi:hypothetical protein CEP52_012165 [Fusarium oligoseptatum]|uniref:Major facilitator superfamily transporter n=1 Tax=Fusarium oligoseptatum TaxID=2604345 RepID=A0A428SZR7_9HYPO|nr:hypothetical protein CEP52_012165 [Fusarium oligoseptatum]
MFLGKKKRVAAESEFLDSNGTTTILEPATHDTNDAPSTAPMQTTPEEPTYPSGLRLALLITSVFVAMFLVSLDRLIITTAIPQITDDFNAVTDIGWYGSAYLLTLCAFQLLFGKIYSFLSIKRTLLSVILLFEIGSTICGAAPNSVVFIIGRAIAGLGAAGIMTGVMVVIVHSVPLHKRPLYQGMFGAVFGTASVVGPLLGGVFTSKVTWRWCFYINLPLGGVAMVVIQLLLNIPDQDKTKLSLKSKILQLDIYGTVLFIPGTVCLVLALEWGGLVHAWNDGRVIVLLVLAGLLLLGFAMVQIFLPKTATIPPRIFMQRSIAAGFFATLCIGSQMMIFTYYLPIWFQAIQGVSAVDSGFRILPTVLSVVVASLSTGILVKRIGYYTPFMILGVCFMSVGAGLLTTLHIDTSTPKLIGYQILYGWGMGSVSQAPNLAAQTVLTKKDIPIGASLMFFSQLLGGTIFVSVAQNMINNQLLHRLSSVPGFSAENILNSGATSLTHLPASIKTTVLVAYNESIRTVFRVGLILVCLTMLGALSMEWLSVKKDVGKQKQEGGEGGIEKTEEKSKKGCITCRIRRVKCDETKPQCKRCQSTKRVCDGYLSEENSMPRRQLVEAVKQLSVIGPVSRALTQTPPSRPISPDDPSYFAFFRSVTIPSTCSLFPSSFWQQSVLQLAHGEPAIWHAAIALGALHQKTEAPATKTNTDIEELSTRAIKHYGKAMALAKDLNSSAKVVSLSLALAASANMLGRWGEMHTHVMAGLGIVSRDVAHGKSLDILGGSLVRVDLQAMTFSDSKSPYPYNESTAAFDLDRFLEIPCIPPSSYEDLSSELFSISRAFFLLDGGLYHETMPYGPWLTKMDGFIRRLVQWEINMAMYESSNTQPTYDEDTTRLSLRLYHVALRILIRSAAFGPETRYDSLLGYFEYAIRLAATLHKRTSGKNTVRVSLEPGLVIPLYLVTHRCRHHALRHAALKMLLKTNRVEGMWRSDATAQCLGTIVAVEEESLGHINTRDYVPSLLDPSSLTIPWSAWSKPSFNLHASVSWDHVPMIPEDKRVKEVYAATLYSKRQAELRLVMCPSNDTNLHGPVRELIVHF